MEEYVLYDALHLVFKYLNYNDLYNASMVNRYWAVVAREENYTRGIVCDILYKNNMSFISRVNWEKEYFQYLLKMSSFRVFLVCKNFLMPLMNSCYCKYQKNTCCSLILHIYCPKTSEAFAVSVIFPDSHKIQINAITFLKIPDSELVFCPELRFILGPVLDPPLVMELNIKRYFDKNSPMKSCMILLCDMSSSYLLKNILQKLNKWFPNSKIFIWGCLVTRILSCKNLMCKAVTECVLIFVSNRNLKTWMMSWSALNETEKIIETKLQEFKQKIELKKYSLALIYKSGILLPDSAIFEILFQKVFPEMPYIYLYGPALLAGEDLQGG
ncbi:hypothetical protein M0802_010208 [Mischocyttarus mexicanus]|nr:hypothetical protein M0802_010208 [Mischocyttarus mexicanus]